jgi:hypothetical protein
MITTLSQSARTTDKIMADEGQRHAHFRPQAPQEVQHLRLCRNIEARDDLVRHHEVRLQRDGTRDAHTLALPARKLVRMARHDAGGKPHPVEDRSNGLLARVEAVKRESARQNGPDGPARVQR